MAEAVARGGAWRWLAAGEIRASGLRFLVAGLAIAVGVALAFAVHLVNRSAADAFGEAVRTVSGDADLQIRGATGLGFDEALYPRLFAIEGVADASPVVFLRATLGEKGEPLTLLGLDMLRAISVSPSLIGRRRGATAGGGGVARAAAIDAALDIDALFLSAAALQRSGLEYGDRVAVRAGGRSHIFRVAGDLPGIAPGQSVAAIDISSAQWRFARLGMLDRIDLSLADGASPAAVRAAIGAMLPPAARLAAEDDSSRRSASLSRAYRVNLDMLALVALITGGFLVWSAQSLSVARRMKQFALVRILGLQRRELAFILLGEGAILGLVGSLAGIALGYALAGAVLGLFGGDLGGGYFAGEAPPLRFAPAAAILFLLFGLAAALAGSWSPARAAGRIAPAAALRSGGDTPDPRAVPRLLPALILVAAGAGAAALPAVGRLPLFGYVAVALVLAGGVAAMPWLARSLLGLLARIDSGRPAAELAVRRLLGTPGQAATALGGIVASTGLMIAMAVMVTSFRSSVDEWLESFLSADLYVAATSSEPLFDPGLQKRLAATPGISSMDFSKSVPVTLDPELPPVMLIARPIAGPGYRLPLIEGGGRGAGVRLYASEPAARLHSLRPGDPVALPIGRGGAALEGHVAGIWRDYARQQGAIVIDGRDYDAATGDRSRSEAAVQLASGATIAGVREGIARRLPPAIAARVDFAEPETLRAFALRLFDRSFAITYGLEAIAILIGLAGVAATISAQTIARIREFGMLRHIGMTRRQIVAMLAAEGAVLGLVGIAAGCAIGLALAQILIQVINPQSFNWTMATRVPWSLIAAVAAALITTSAGTAMLAGRRAVSPGAVRAVSEDW